MCFFSMKKWLLKLLKEESYFMNVTVTSGHTTCTSHKKLLGGVLDCKPYCGALSMCEMTPYHPGAWVPMAAPHNVALHICSVGTYF